MRDQQDTKQRHHEIIRRLAVESFAQHQVSEVGAAGDTRVFACARPGTGIYAFRVIVWPGWFVVAGDVGDTLFRHSDRDSLAWLRGARNDVPYLLGKVQGARKVFMAGDADAFIEEIATNHGEFADDKRPRLGDRHFREPRREDCESDEDFAIAMREVQRQLDEENKLFDEEAKGYRERAEKIREAWSADTGTPDDFYRACQEADIDDPPDCLDHASDHLWAVEALRWFIGAYDARASASAETK